MGPRKSKLRTEEIVLPGGDIGMENLRIVNPNWFIQPLSAEKPVLAGSRCRKCGKIFFPKKRVCIKCFSMDNMEELPLSRRGELYCYTVAYAAPEGFKPPYAFGRVILPEGIRLFAIFQDCAPYESVLKIGGPMELSLGAIAKDEAGEDLFSYVFRPVGE